MILVHLSELEARAVVETLNRAWDEIPNHATRRAVDRAGTRIEAALRRERGEKGAAA